MYSSLSRRSAAIIAGRTVSLLLAVPALTRLLERAIDAANGFNFSMYDIRDEADLAISLLPDRAAVVVDAGANDGSWSGALLRQAGPQQVGALLLIEPNEIHEPAHAELAREFACVRRTEWSALGRQSATMTMFHAGNTRHASLYDRYETADTPIRQTQVSVLPLTELIARHDLGRIDFLKLDIEGHELEALAGAEKLLLERRIGAMQFEFGGANVDSRTYVRDFWNLLVASHGYTLYRLLPGRRLRAIPKYSVRLERFMWHNMLACAPGKRPGWRCD
jgi:FkbM family methyltransferase